MSGSSYARVLLLAAACVIGVAACTAATAEPIAPEPAGDFTPVTALAPASTTTTAPPTTTTSTTTTTTTTLPPKGRLVINGTGDVNLDPSFVRSFPRRGYEYAWTGLHGLFHTDDITIVNLECSASDLGSKWVKAYNFRCDTEALPPMANAGVDVANLANNHSIDYGFEAMLDAMQNLTANGVAPVGTGANAAEAYTPLLLDIKGWTVAILGGGGVHPETGSWIATDDRPGMTDGDSIEAMTAAIRAADEIADLVFVTIHWGEQGTVRPRGTEIRQAEAFIDAGADGIFGHHQHRLQPLGWYGGRPIAWGLGNFVWQAGAGRNTAIAQFVVEPDGRIHACLLPVVIQATGHPVLQEPHQTLCPGVDDGAR